MCGRMMKQESSESPLTSLPAKALPSWTPFPAACGSWLQPSGPTAPQQLRHFLLPLFRGALSVLAPLRLQLMLVGEQSAPPPGLAALCEAPVRFSVLKKALPESP